MKPDDDVRLDSLLRRLPPGPSVSFTEDVMRRVRATPQPAATPAPAYDQTWLPWWTRALLQPATIGALVVAGVFAGWSAELLRGAARLSSSLSAALASGSLNLPGWSSLLIVSVLGSLVLAHISVRGIPLLLSGNRPTRR